MLDISLEMRPLMVLIGANGVGKTSLLDAFSLLSATASGNMNGALSDLGGIAHLLTRGMCDSLSMAVELEDPAFPPLKYEIVLSPTGMGYSISKEILSQHFPDHPGPLKHIDSTGTNICYYNPEANKSLPPDWEHNPLESSLSQVPKAYRQVEDLRRILATATQYHVLDVDSRAPVKLPQQMKPAKAPGPNGETLFPFLYHLRDLERDRFDVIVDSLRAAFPGLEEVTLPPAAAGMLALAWKEKGFEQPFYMHELSEGTLRFLWLASLLQGPNLSTVTTIDEPEVSMHPEMLSLLADLMRGASRRTQLVVATHSDRLIRFLDPREVVVMDLDENGLATAAWADELDMEHWLADYSLDELWRMGQLGGRA